MTDKLEIMNLYIQIQALEERAKDIKERSIGKELCRELTLSITKLQESRLWLSELLANSGEI